MPAVNPIPFKHMPHCKLYASGIVVHPSVSGLYDDSTTVAAAAFVPSQHTSKLYRLKVAPSWSGLTGAFFSKTYPPCLSAAGETICLAWLAQVLITSVTSRLVVTAENHRTRIKETERGGKKQKSHIPDAHAVQRDQITWWLCRFDHVPPNSPILLLHVTTKLHRLSGV